MHLNFRLNVEDGWPPVATESLPFERLANGYRALGPPLFLKDLSVGDVIVPTLDADDLVTAWEHLHRSANTTIWLLRLAPPDHLEHVLDEVRALGCNTTGVESLGCYAIDVPAQVSMNSVDACLAVLDGEQVAVAFPSHRHPDEPAN